MRIRGDELERQEKEQVFAPDTVLVAFRRSQVLSLNAA
jgi:hypothetical protein